MRFITKLERFIFDVVQFGLSHGLLVFSFCLYCVLIIIRGEIMLHEFKAHEFVFK